MKKLILPLLLLVAFGMLAAVESDPSNVVGYVKYPCVAGGNAMIALPMAPAYATAGAVGVAVGAGCDAVSKFNASSQEFVSTFDYGDGFEEDFPVYIGDPLLVYTYSETNFYSIGDLPTPATYNLLVGNNMIMIPLNKSDLDTDVPADGIQAGEVGVDLAAGFCDAVSMFNSAAQEFMSTFDYGDGFEEDFDTPGIGTPLLVYSYNAFTWSGAKSLNVLPTTRSK